MKLTEAKFKRRFSVNYYKNLTLPLGEMSLYKDWHKAAGRGDPYPIYERTEGVAEDVGDGKYTVTLGEGGKVCRLMGGYLPWATYDVDFDSDGSIGLSLMGGETVDILLSQGTLALTLGDEVMAFDAPTVKRGTLSVSFRGIGVSVYLIADGKETLICDVLSSTVEQYSNIKLMESAKVALVISGTGKTVISRAQWYLSAGISQADLRPVCYEDGTPIIEGGRVFLTATARSVEKKYQVVLSWCPSTCDFRLEGGIFFEFDDGSVHGDVASCLIYDRTIERWRIVMCAFSHGHVIGYGKPICDPRFGINIINITPMKQADENSALTDFVTFSNDEDPAVVYHDGKWYMAICRSDEGGYKYFHFISDDGGKSFRYLARTEGVEKTGGSYVRCGKDIYFVCGSDFKKRACYDVYSLDDLSHPVSYLDADFDDGGFRGWGSVMLLPYGSKMRYTWITFDRHLASHFNWSYGNIHVFDSESFIPD